MCYRSRLYRQGQLHQWLQGMGNLDVVHVIDVNVASLHRAAISGMFWHGSDVRCCCRLLGVLRQPYYFSFFGNLAISLDENDIYRVK
jgi:hypothetical protein